MHLYLFALLCEAWCIKMMTWESGFILVCFLFLIFLVLRRVFEERNKLFEVRIKKNSARYKALKKLNNQVGFQWELCSKYIFHEEVKSKAQFDRFNFDQMLLRIIEEELSSVSELIKKVEINRTRLKWYNNEIRHLPEYSGYQVLSQANVPAAKFRKIEVTLCEREIIYPIVAPEVECQVSYRSMHGRNEYYDSIVYSYEQLLNAYEMVQRRIDYRDTVYYQRKKMTDSLRYDILKRDGFRCVLCGRTSNDGVKLQVDHIIPVSKGGKTEIANLRTLCNECNMGKRDKYDPYGNN